MFDLSEVDLPLKKDGFTSEGTTLEALLRGEGLEKKIDTKEEDTLQEIQVISHFQFMKCRIVCAYVSGLINHYFQIVRVACKKIAWSPDRLNK